MGHEAPGQQQQQEQNYPPPPPYTPPGYVHHQNSQYPKGPQPSAPPPPPGFQPNVNVTSQQQPQPLTVIYHANTTTVAQFGPYPMRYTCPNCNAHIMTETHSTPGLLTYILSGTLCFLAGYLLCCLVPCCVRECKDIEHKCPNCGTRLGLYKRI